VVEPQETAAGDEVLTPPTEVQVPVPPRTDAFQRVPLASTAKMLLCPFKNEVLTAGPVPVIVVPLMLAALLTTAKSERSIRVAKTMLLVIRL
jgi:hypothetical protein